MYTNDLDLVAKSIPTLKVILIVTLIFAIGSMSMHGIMGIGDTKTMLVIEFLCIASYIAYSYCAIYIWKLSLPMIWMTEFVYWILLTILTTSYLANGKWKHNVKHL